MIPKLYQVKKLYRFVFFLHYAYSEQKDNLESFGTLLSCIFSSEEMLGVFSFIFRAKFKPLLGEKYPV